MRQSRSPRQEGSRQLSSTPSVWNEKSKKAAFHAVLSTRWSAEQCATVDEFQRREILTGTGSLEGQRVLDLGCGIGRLSGALAHESALVVGVDYSSGMLRRAAAEVRASNTIFIEASAVSLPFPDSHFDVVVASFVFQHILRDDDFRSACSEVVRVLGPRGAMVCMDGVAQEQFRPTGSQYTVVRTLSHYRDSLSSEMRLEVIKELRCVDDDYLLMRWIRMDTETTVGA